MTINTRLSCRIVTLALAVIVLPAGTAVAHKTGSIGGTTNDVGIITLPNDAGHVAIAVFVKASDEDTEDRERAIAEIARAAHDFFLFRPEAEN